MKSVHTGATDSYHASLFGAASNVTASYFLTHILAEAERHDGPRRLPCLLDLHGIRPGMRLGETWWVDPVGETDLAYSQQVQLNKGAGLDDLKGTFQLQLCG